MNVTGMNYVKEGWANIKSKIDSIDSIYSYEDTKRILADNDFYKQFIGRAKNRTMMKHYPELFKSVYTYTHELETAFKRQNSYKWTYGFVRRLEFIVLHDCQIERLRCVCGKKYSWTEYCRYCPDTKRTFLGKVHTLETKLKMRTSALNIIQTTAGQVAPRYNRKSISVLESIAATMGITDLQHAENGGEYAVLGYFLDGYSPEKNIAFEFDERGHFTANGELREKDIQRQQEIEAYLGCTFIRIKDEF
jgi:hypothetical protein